MPTLNFPALQQKAKDIFSHFFQKNQYEKELKDLLYQSKAAPEDMRIKMSIAETYFKSRDIQKAVETYKEIAEFYEKEDFVLKAVSAYKSILKIEPAHFDVNLKLAELYKNLDMISDAANQCRIAMEGFSLEKDQDSLIETAQKLVALDPSPSNRRKLAEIYHSHGKIREAVKEYEAMARDFKKAKKYDDLVRVSEMILPHQSQNQNLIRDVCILYLRRQEPENAIRTIEQYKMESEPAFESLITKARQMQEILRKSGGRLPEASAS